MARPRRKKRRAAYALGLPMIFFAGLFAVVADNFLAAAAIGALVGFIVGIGIMAFPNLDRDGPADTDDMLN
jgi:NADH:ubiquinone oxidoreductase subunit 6 (subunit J)